MKNELQSKIHPEIYRMLKKPLKGILREILSNDRHIKGLALEALAFYIARSLDLKHVGTYRRSKGMDDTEADLIFECAHLVFPRWQIRCTNTEVISLEDVATEVGLMIHFGSQVVVIINTGVVSAAAWKYVKLVHNEYGKKVVIIGSKEIMDMANATRSLQDILESQMPSVLVRVS